MFITDDPEYGTVRQSFLEAEGFPWVYPLLCGCQKTKTPVVPCGETGGLVVYILSGEGEATLGGDARHIAGGFAVTARDARELSLCPEGELVYFYLLLQNAQLLLERLAEQDFVLAGAGESRAGRLLGRIYYNARAGLTGSIYHASADAFALLMALCGHCGAPAAYTQLVREAMAVLQEEYAFLGGVDELAERMGVSKSHLIRCFTAAVGVSPGRYLQTIKIENAKLMLQNCDYSVEMIADMVGYAGANYFCKVFRRVTGESPGAYRARQTPAVLDAESRRRLAALEGITHI